MLHPRHRLLGTLVFGLSVGLAACADEDAVMVREPGPAPVPVSGGMVAGPALMIHSAVNPGLCADVAGDVPEPHATVQLFSCHGRENQRWNVAPGPNGATITGLGGLCLDIHGRQPQDGATAQVFPCNGGGNQRFGYRPDGRLQEVATGKCLTAMAIGDGAPLAVEPCDPRNAAQVWSIGPR